MKSKFQWQGSVATTLAHHTSTKEDIITHKFNLIFSFFIFTFAARNSIHLTLANAVVSVIYVTVFPVAFGVTAHLFLRSIFSTRIWAVFVVPLTLLLYYQIVYITFSIEIFAANGVSEQMRGSTAFSVILVAAYVIIFYLQTHSTLRTKKKTGNHPEFYQPAPQRWSGLSRHLLRQLAWTLLCGTAVLLVVAAVAAGWWGWDVTPRSIVLSWLALVSIMGTYLGLLAVTAPRMLPSPDRLSPQQTAHELQGLWVFWFIIMGCWACPTLIACQSGWLEFADVGISWAVCVAALTTLLVPLIMALGSCVPLRSFYTSDGIAQSK